MPSTNEFLAALIDNDPDRTALYEALARRGAYVIVSGEDATDLVPAPLTTHLIYNGLVFWYDAADATTAHDGVTCIVTFDGKRFKSDAYNGRGLRTYAVIDKDLTAPPGSPVLGAAYIVAAGGSGEWATKDKKIAVATARGWVFIQPNAFDQAFVIDETLVYHYSAGGAWTSGVPGVVLPAGGVNISSLKYGLGLRVFNQTTTAPPGSPSEGHAYIIATGGSGAWAGHDLKIAIWESGAWTILTPVDGWTVYDVSTNRPVYWEGSEWVDPFVASGQWQVIEDRNVASLVSQVDFTSGLIYNHIRASLFGVVGSVATVLISRISEDGGATFKAGAADYIYAGGTNDYLRLTESNVTTTLEGVFGSVEYYNFGLAKRGPVHSRVSYMSGSSAQADHRGNAMNLTNARDAIRFAFLSGTIKGRFLLEGRD